ncbi:VOC family protein [Pelagibacterium limicola]|uniref:VOC family protein n=1 Tax=Pelagibacterium limicola TaxID=2791022 RepID=UPI001A9B0094|nr:VOC family protein [Pelagibacterium limicola]
MAKATSIMPMLSVNDFAKSMRFYRDRLGGVQNYQFPPEGEPEFVVLGFGTGEIGFGLVNEAPMHGQAQRPARGHRIELCIYVDNVDTAMAELEQDGAPVLASPKDQPWGERVAFVGDPDGNIVMLVTPTS